MMSSKPTGLNRQPPALPQKKNKGYNQDAAKGFQGNSRTLRQHPPLTSNTDTFTYNRTASQGNSRTLRQPPPLGAKRQLRPASTIALTKKPPPITHLQHQKKQLQQITQQQRSPILNQDQKRFDAWGGSWAKKLYNETTHKQATNVNTSISSNVKSALNKRNVSRIQEGVTFQNLSNVVCRPITDDVVAAKAYINNSEVQVMVVKSSEKTEYLFKVSEESPNFETLMTIHKDKSENFVNTTLMHQDPEAFETIRTSIIGLSKFCEELYPKTSPDSKQSLTTQKPSRGRSETSIAVDNTLHLVTVQQNLEWEINTQADLLNQNRNFVEARGGEVPNYDETMQIIVDNTSAQLADAQNFTSNEIDELQFTIDRIVSDGNESLQVVAEYVQENGASAINPAIEQIDHTRSCFECFCEAIGNFFSDIPNPFSNIPNPFCCFDSN